MFKILLCCRIAPNPKIEELNIAACPTSPGAVREEPGLKDLLHAADLVPCVEVFDVEEVQQSLRHVLILIDDVLAKGEREESYV